MNYVKGYCPHCKKIVNFLVDDTTGILDVTNNKVSHCLYCPDCFEEIWMNVGPSYDENDIPYIANIQ